MRLILDAGALVAVERAHRDVVALIKRELTAGRTPLTHGGVVGQVWRGGSGRRSNARHAARASMRLIEGFAIADAEQIEDAVESHR